MNLIKNICVFGTGSAGWITALNLSDSFPDILITVLNPLKTGNIGVGESTQPNITNLMKRVGLDYDDFLQSTDSTLKHGIYYKNWYKKNTEYWHPFTDLTESSYYTSAHYYQQLIMHYPDQHSHEDYYSNVHESYDLCVKGKKASIDMPWAIHMDANLMGQYFKRHLINLSNVRVIDYNDYTVEVNENKINSITCDGQKIEADLFIDCTGFKKALLSKINDCKTDNYQGNVNTALFGRMYYEDVEDKSRAPYTLVDAHANGWAWTIPLQSKMGTGWVYNSDFCDEETARENFSKYWNGKLDISNVNTIKFTSDSLIKPWVSNVVAIGLSAGFVEPLEATSIAWFIYGSDLLGSSLHSRYYDDNIIERYNYMMRSYIEDVQDFVDVHYVLSARDDSEFWKYQNNKPVHPRLNQKLNVYRDQMPSKNTRETTNQPWAFNDVSWIDILNGYNFKYNKQTGILGNNLVKYKLLNYNKGG